MNSKKLNLVISFLFFYFSSLVAQESNINSVDSIKSSSIKLPNAPQAEQGDVDFNDGTNSLLRITDEGTFGAIELKSGIPSTTTNKLYNDSGILKFNGSSLSGSGATSLDDLSDSKVTGNSYFIGDGAGAAQSSSSANNIGFGENALNLNGSGELNTALGNQALVANDNGNNNTAVGFSSLSNNSSGYENTAIGSQALPSNKAGIQNIAVGYQALYSNDNGSGNIAIGRSTLSSNINGGANIGIGTGALQYSKGNYNISIGFQANKNNENGSRNTIIGYRAGDSDGLSLHDKSGNIFLGYQAGYNETGSDKLYIDNSSTPSPLIYGDFVSDKIGINGKLGVGTTNPSDVLHVVGTTGQNGLRVQVGNATKLRTYSNGGTSLGLNNSSGTPENGLYVHGNTELNADTDIGGNLNISGNTVINGTTQIGLNGTTQIGANGTPFAEIVKISGSLDPNSFIGYVNYPSPEYNMNNTVVIGYKILDNSNRYHQFSAAANSGMDFIGITLTSTEIQVKVSDSNLYGNSFQLVLMRID